MADDQQRCRLEVCTSHPVTLEVQGADTEDADLPARRTVTLTPIGPMARVEEPVASTAVLLTDHGGLREIRMRRSRRIRDLPPKQRGVVYVVARLTALAAWRRDDLIFPTHEWRDERGIVAGAEAVGRFVSGWSPHWWAGTLGRAVKAVPGWRPGKPPDWVIAVVFALATALLGAALGTLADVVAEGWSARGAQAGRRRDALLWLGGGGVLALLAGGTLWGWRNHVLSRRGTAYLVDEIADLWTYEETRSFRAGVKQQFAAVLEVPGPDDLGARWSWPLDQGAGRWSERIDDLVRGFWAVQFNDDQGTANALYVWAAWPVAIAFGSRSVYGRRGVTLQVRQRPTGGRVGIYEKVEWRQHPQTFEPVLLGSGVDELEPAGPSPQWSLEWSKDAASDVVGGPTARVLTWRAIVTVADHADSLPVPNDSSGDDRLHILLVRMAGTRWGPLAGQSEPARADAPVTLTAQDAAGLGVRGPLPATIHELRCLPEPGPFHDWESFGALAQVATRWVAKTAAHMGPGPVLLGMNVPQEVAVGIGVHLARLDLHGWPADLRPLVWDDGRHIFVIPGLNLGWASTHPRIR